MLMSAIIVDIMKSLFKQNDPLLSERGEMNLFQNKLNSWILDYEWLKTAKEQSSNKDLVTLDIFDTCLTRDVESPVDIFCRVEKKLSQHDLKFSGFASAREKAEQNARKKAYSDRGLAEVSFDMIYEELTASRTLSDKDLNIAKQVELEVEENSLFPIPDLLAFVKYLNEQKIKYSFVSDMYLPSQFLARILKNAGYTGWEDIVVSCECQKTKAVGDIWKLPLFEDKKILHIGDNLNSDVDKPRKLPLINTLLYDRGRSETRCGCELAPAILPFSEQNRLLEIELRLDPEDHRSSNSDRKRLFALGESFGALILGSFTAWLKEHLEKNNIKNVYFFSRDGWLMREAWRILNPKTEISDYYLYVSRKTLTLAFGYLKSTAEQIDEATLYFLSYYHNKITIGEVLNLLDLSSPEIKKKAKKHFGSLSKTIYRNKNRAQLISFFKIINPEIYIILRTYYQNIVGYMRQEGLFSHEKIAIIDMGWNGTMQKGLSQICKSIDENFQCYGFYYGLWRTASGNRYLAGPMESAFFNEFDSLTPDNVKTQGVDILEELHTSSEGSTSGYRMEGNLWYPIKDSSPREETQYKNLIQPFQQGTLQAVTNIINTGSYKKISSADLTIPNAIMAYMQLFLSPTNSEVGTLIKIAHGVSFDHTLNSLMDSKLPSNPRSLEKSIQNCCWIIGVIRYFIAASPTKNKAKIRALAKNYLSFLSERQLQIIERD